MTASADLHAALADRLRIGLAGRVTVYDGDVPDSPPAATDGRVWPYAVVWPSPGAAPSEAAVDDGASGIAWLAQVTVAAGDIGWCLTAVDTTRRAALIGPLAPAAGPLVDETPLSRTIMRNQDVKPPRWFVPLLFTCLTA